jgi:hypothetical protein
MQRGNGETMKLPSIRPSATKEPKAVDADPKAGDADPKSPHYFQEAFPGVVPCALCRGRESDPIHLTVEANESPRWGM